MGVRPKSAARCAAAACLTAAACVAADRDGYRGPRYEITRVASDAGREAADDPDGSPGVADGDGDGDEVIGDAGPDEAGDASPVLEAGPPAACSIEVTTRSPAGRYANAYVCAIWIADSDGALVRTLALYGGQRARYLTAFQKVRGGASLDATSHATINASRSKAAGNDVLEHRLRWALDEPSGQRVAEGVYTLNIETTSNSGTGAVVSAEFTVGEQRLEVTPPDADNVSARSIRCE